MRPLDGARDPRENHARLESSPLSGRNHWGGTWQVKTMTVKTLNPPVSSEVEASTSQAEAPDLEACYQAALAQVKSGRLDEAIPQLQEVVRQRADWPEAWHNLGVALARRGQLDEAIAAFQQALRQQPEAPDTLSNLGRAYLQKGQPEAAAACYRQVIRRRPDALDAYLALGVALRALGKLEEAESYCRQAIALAPDNSEAHHSLALTLAQQGKNATAEISYREALRLRPDFPEAHNNLGIALEEQGKLDEAIAHFRESLRLRPEAPETHSNLGVALAAQGKLDEAAACHQQALRLKPDYAEAYNNLGNVLRAQGDVAAAIACHRRALRLRPGYAEAYNNLGIDLVQEGRLEDALTCYERALRLKPDYPEAHLNRALAWLALGQFDKGWLEYEWRWKGKEMPPRWFAQPRWDGTPLAGRTLLIYTEQGLGDTLQFIRYAPLVKASGGRVLVECPPALVPLVSTCPGIDRVLPQGAPLPPFDVQVPLLSLPGLMGTTLETIPAKVPYLFPDAALRRQWGQYLQAYPGFRVGLAWQGNPKYRGDQQRSIPLRSFAPLGQLPGLRLFSLQKGYGIEQLAHWPGPTPILHLGEQLDTTAGAFMDTAALMVHLDLVITSDTAVAHLAGALGVPVWVALPYACDWRWLRQRTDSPWYPSMRLFRQSEPGNWEEVFAQIASQLRSQIHAKEDGRTVHIEVSVGELLDKLTILQIKAQRLTDPRKQANVAAELAHLTDIYEREIPLDSAGRRLLAELRAVNEALWQIEEDLRACERQQDFGPRFVDLARAVYRHNDQRAALKRQLNDLLGSRFREEKSYC
jgi:tetratricopeptide (TPR) repeat protein